MNLPSPSGLRSALAQRSRVRGLDGTYKASLGDSLLAAGDRWRALQAGARLTTRDSRRATA
eukprot:2296458-Alexandrium_andersonii.AAC.1